MHASLVPTPSDLAGLLAYVLSNPYLFISSSTVMTTGLVAGAFALTIFPRTAPALRLAGPPLSLPPLYFSVRRMAPAAAAPVPFPDMPPGAPATHLPYRVGHTLAA